eukprot:scaffold5796_cov98-Skeletonema_marinoi.AAC.4
MPPSSHCDNWRNFDSWRNFLGGFFGSHDSARPMGRPSPVSLTLLIHSLQQFGLACTKRLPSTYGDQPVPSRPQGVFGHSPAPPGLSSPFY